MVKKFLAIFIVLLTISIVATGFAGNLSRIKFRKGTFGKTVSSYLNGYKAQKLYVLWARKGQNLKAEQVRSEDSLRIVSLVITNPSGTIVSEGDASCGSRKSVKLPETGNYRIKVTECLKADEWKGKFFLRVFVR